MSVSRLSTYFERAVSISGVRQPRCIYDKNRGLDWRRQSRRALGSSTRQQAGIIDTFKSDDYEDALRAQDQLDADELEPFSAAPELDFDNFKPGNMEKDEPPSGYIKEIEDMESGGNDRNAPKDTGRDVLRTLRIVPASPSYFTAKPRFTDDYVYILGLMRRSQLLPTVKPGDQPRVAWRDFETYRGAVDEPVKRSRYREIVDALRRMNMIHPALMPDEVRATLDYWARDLQPSSNVPNPIEVDEFGRAAAVGRRKSSSAKAWVVEGNGQVMVNGKPLHQAFARTHDRESVIWALKVTQRLDKYNVWGMANGGGTTGQAEALTLAVSKALMAHEPLLKTSLRIGEYSCEHHVYDPLLTIHSWLCLS